MTTLEHVGIVLMAAGTTVIVRIKVAAWWQLKVFAWWRARQSRPKKSDVLVTVVDRKSEQAILAKKAVYLETLRKLDRISERRLH